MASMQDQASRHFLLQFQWNDWQMLQPCLTFILIVVIFIESWEKEASYAAHDIKPDKKKKRLLIKHIIGFYILDNII